MSELRWGKTLFRKIVKFLDYLPQDPPLWAEERLRQAGGNGQGFHLQNNETIRKKVKPDSRTKQEKNLEKGEKEEENEKSEKKEW